MNYSINDLRNHNYFMLYDLNDNIVCYFESYDELLKWIKIPLKYLVFKFKNAQEYINVIVDKKMYKLYTYTD